MEITPFKGLQIISTESDEKVVDALLDESGDHYVMCDVCEGTAFVVEALIKAELEISFGIPDKQMIVRERKDPNAMVLRIVKCATCNSTDFIKERIRSNVNVSKTESACFGKSHV